MRLAAILSLVTLVCIVATRDGFASDDLPPPGVRPNNWISLSEDVGFVIDRESGADGISTLEGHFLARHNGSWKVLDTDGGFRVMPAPGF